jgi:hypothetical protein
MASFFRFEKIVSSSATNFSTKRSGKKQKFLGDLQEKALAGNKGSEI